MTVPIVVVFERHWDSIPKSLVKDLLPSLNEKGYGTLCFEAPQDLTSEQIIENHRLGLESDLELQKQSETRLRQFGIVQTLSEISFSSFARQLQLYVSSQRYLEVAEKIKQLPASIVLKEVFDEAERLQMSLQGIDIPSTEFYSMTSLDLSKRMSIIEQKETIRIDTMVQNLLKIRREEGVIFICGALHAEGLIREFKKQGLEDEVLYYFPHSSSRYEETIDDVNEIAVNDTLLNHTHRLSQKEIKPFGNRIIQEINQKIKYKNEILENSHSRFLKERFNANFRAFVRPGSYVDALVDMNESNIQDIQTSLNSLGVSTHCYSLEGRVHLVVPGVNTKEIAKKIRA